MSVVLREYQLNCVQDALHFLSTGGMARCYASPTGTGKSLIELTLLSELPNAWLIAPTPDIIRGMVRKLGGDERLGTEALMTWVAQHRITTSMRLRNAMLRDEEWTRGIDALLIDEGHHAEAMTYKEIRAMLPGVPIIMFTATPYRGTPRSTLEFRATWGEPKYILTLPEAVKRGYAARPRFSVHPLLDDDLVEVQNGEFSVTSSNELFATKLDSAASLVADAWERDRRPTVVFCGSTEQVHALRGKLQSLQVPTNVVTADSDDEARVQAFDAMVQNQAVLLNVRVVGEGVDLPVERIIDFAPTMSPVLWMQRVGRFRPVPPGTPDVEYWCACRNIERHGYLYSGVIPTGVVREAQQAFGQPSRSTGARAVGFEGLGKFRAVPLPLRDGLVGSMYAMQDVQSTGQVMEYVVLLHPSHIQPFVACRERGNGETGYGKWKRVPNVPDIVGTPRSYPSGQCTPKQLAWWQRSARQFGLDNTVEPTQKQFAALPVLADTGYRML